MEKWVNKNEVVIHPLNRQVRGRYGDMTVLKESIAESGQADPISCVLMPDGRYGAIDGGRRITSIKALDEIEHVWIVVEQLTDEQILDRIASSDIKEPLPHVVAVDGEIVGGRAWLAMQFTGGDVKKRRAASAKLGVSPDVISAYLNLFREPESTIEAVASGKLEITAYARMKYQSEEFKKVVLAPALEKGYKVQVRRVMKALEHGVESLERYEELIDQSDETLQKVDVNAWLFQLYSAAATLFENGFSGQGCNNELWSGTVQMIKQMEARE